METNTKTHAQDISYDSWDETGMQFSEETPLKTKQSKGKCIRYEPFEGKRHQSCQIALYLLHFDTTSSRREIKVRT